MGPDFAFEPYSANYEYGFFNLSSAPGGAATTIATPSDTQAGGTSILVHFHYFYLVCSAFISHHFAAPTISYLRDTFNVFYHLRN